MLKIKSYITSEVNGREFEFCCPPDSPLGDALEANTQHRAFLLGRQQLAEEAKKQAEQPVEKQVE